MAKGESPERLKSKTLVFRIRKEYFDAIVSGEKKVEYRKDSDFWKKRSLNAAIAVFLCGKRVHRRQILQVQKIKTPKWFSEQGQKDVDTPTCFAFYLGSELKGKSLKQKKEDALKFVEHIQKHIDDGDIDPLIREPQCKICLKYLSEIVKEETTT